MTGRHIRAEFRGLGVSYPQSSISAQVRHFAQSKADMPAVITPQGALCWGDLDRKADQLAAALAARGLEAGARLGFLGRNGLDFPVVLLAARRARLALVGLNWRLSAEEMANIIARAQPALVIADADFEKLLPADCAVVHTGAALDAMCAQDHPAIDRTPQDDDITTIFFTSGTTGEPKAIAYTLEAAESQTFAPSTLDFSEDSRLLIVAPVFHTAGWMWAQYGLAGGMTQIQLPAASPTAMLEAVDDLGATHAQWVPAMLASLLAEQQRRPIKPGILQMVAYGSSPISETLLIASMQAFGCRFTQVYGLTESIGPLTHLPPDAHSDIAAGKSQATGIANPGVEIRIVDDAGQPVPRGALGEVWVRQPCTPAVFWQLDGAHKPVVDAQGWLHTGDVGYLDADDFLFITDRIKDMIISGGENVYPVEVEKILAAAPDVEDVAVFGLPDSKWGERVVAAVVPRAGAGVDSAALIRFCRDHLAHYKCPTHIFETTCFPRNASGKILRRALPELFGKA